MDDGNTPEEPPQIPETKCEIVLSFPKGPHTTEIAMAATDIDVNQLIIAHFNLGHYIENTIKELEEQAKEPVRRGLSGRLFDPRTAKSPANAEIIDLKKR